MQSASKGKVQTIRQGYLSKRSSNLRGDWKRRFFVLDSRGMLYYYRKQNSKPSVSRGIAIRLTCISAFNFTIIIKMYILVGRDLAIKYLVRGIVLNLVTGC